MSEFRLQLTILDIYLLYVKVELNRWYSTVDQMLFRIHR